MTGGWAGREGDDWRVGREGGGGRTDVSARGLCTEHTQHLPLTSARLLDRNGVSICTL